MINASRTLSSAALGPAIIRRRPRRPLLLLAPPSAFAEPLPVADVAAWTDWRGDLRFFLGCYAAGLAFFLIMLS